MSYPKNVGIKAIEIYFPSTCIEQSQLESHDGVGTGKYTIGLGQTKMAVCDDREDIYSLALTAVSSLLQKYSIAPESIGRLEVGTETLLDKSKSVKTVLMQLFTPSGNTNIEGVDTINACYGGTSALFNAVNWVESRAWDGRNAIVVAGDIAVYSKGAARPTGGAGIVAMLVGPNAPLVLDPGRRGTYMQHTYDFYKPDLSSEYPVVDGHYSNECYTNAVDACYKAYLESATRNTARNSALAETNGHEKGLNGRFNGDAGTIYTPTSTPEEKEEEEESAAASVLENFDYMCFHAPNCKMVAKSYARLFYNDYLAQPTSPRFADVLSELTAIPSDMALAGRSIEKVFMGLSKKAFAERVLPSTLVPTMCGNMYSGSLYSSLVSLLSNVSPDDLAGKRIGMFSYGSGLASSMFSLKVVGDTGEMAAALDVGRRLQERTVVDPHTYETMMELREKAFLHKNYTPVGNAGQITKGAYYLEHVDDKWRRSYKIAQ